MAGRIPQPATLKLAKGRTDETDSGGRKVKSGPNFDRSLPTPPSMLPELARQMWDDLVPRLAKMGLTKPEDAYALTCLCLAWDRMWNAATAAEHWAASREIRAWAPHFGLTPSSEQGLGMSDDKDESDPFQRQLPDAV